MGSGPAGGGRAGPAAGRLRRDPASGRLRAGDRDLRVGVRRPRDRVAPAARGRTCGLSRGHARAGAARRGGTGGAGPDARRRGARGSRHAGLGGRFPPGRAARAIALERARRAVAGGRGGALGPAGPDRARAGGSGDRGARRGPAARPAPERGAMRTVPRWRAAALLAAAASALLALAVARWAAVRYEAAFARRSAATTAAYLALVTPPAPLGADYSLQQLFIQTRSLDALPGWTPSVEVYHGTAPLLQPGAPPLSRLVLDRLRGQSGASWGRGVALAPLFDRDRWEVVGAVAIRPAGIAPGWLGGWTLPALALFAAAALGALRAVGGEWERVRRALRAYGAAGVLFGAAAYANVQQAARASTDQWLPGAPPLMPEASPPPPPGPPTPARDGRGLVVPRARHASPRRLLLRPDPPRGLRVGAPLEPGRARAAVRGSRQLRPAGAGPGRVDLASQYGALHPDGARDDGGSARRGPRARPPQLGRALGAHGGLPAVRVIGRRSRARVAVDVPHRFRRDQLDAVARRCGARGLARESEHRPDRLDDRLPVGTGRLSDDRVPRRTAGDSTGLPRRGACGRRRRLATVPDDHLAVAQAGDALRVRHRHHQLVSGLHVRLRAHGRRSRARDGRRRPPAVSGRLDVPAVRLGERAVAALVRRVVCGDVGPAPAAGASGDV